MLFYFSGKTSQAGRLKGVNFVMCKCSLEDPCLVFLRRSLGLAVVELPRLERIDGLSSGSSEEGVLLRDALRECESDRKVDWRFQSFS